MEAAEDMAYLSSMLLRSMRQKQLSSDGGHGRNGRKWYRCQWFTGGNGQATYFKSVQFSRVPNGAPTGGGGARVTGGAGGAGYGRRP